MPPTWVVIGGFFVGVGTLVLTIIVLYTKLVRWGTLELESMKGVLSLHAQTMATQTVKLTEHGTQMAAMETRYMAAVERIEERHSLLSDALQRLIGRSEIEQERRWTGQDRRGQKRHT